jgi:hypothetical protein
MRERAADSRVVLPSLSATAWSGATFAALQLSRVHHNHAALEQRVDLRLATRPVKVPELAHWILAAAAREQHLAEAIAILALQAAVVLDPLHGVRVEDLAPDVGVIPAE